MLPFPLKSERQNIRIIGFLIMNAERMKAVSIANEKFGDAAEMQQQIRDLKHVLFEILMNDRYRIDMGKDESVMVRGSV